MPESKERNSSGLSSIELELACDSLKKLRETVVITEEDQADTAEQLEDFLQQLDNMITSMEARREGPQTLSFSSATEETLTRFNIKLLSGLRLKRGIEGLVERSKLVGKDEIWSSSNLHSHLAKLEELVTTTCSTAAIRTKQVLAYGLMPFFFRASEMIPRGSHMVLNIEHAIPFTAINPTKLVTMSGIADYIAVVAKDHDADAYHDDPRVATARLLQGGFFVTEAKDKFLPKYIPQALRGLYASGKQLHQDTIRGALTNGRDWKFIILSFDKDGQGASYKISTTFTCPVVVSLNGARVPQEPWPDVIAGILSHWVQRSFADIDDEDWLEVANG